MRVSNPFKAILPILCLGFAVIAFTSCSDETENKPEEESMQVEDAVDVMTGALQASSEGMTQDIYDATYTASAYTEKGPYGPCNLQYDSTITRDIENAYIIGAYTLSWGWSVNCNESSIPESLDFNQIATGNYESKRLKSDDSATSDLFVDNLIFGEDFAITGTYNREGTQESKVRNRTKFSSQVTITLTELLVDKGTLKIQNGSGSFIISGQTNNGIDFSYEGTITYVGDELVIITINGETYEIEL